MSNKPPKPPSKKELFTKQYVQPVKDFPDKGDGRRLLTLCYKFRAHLGAQQWKDCMKGCQLPGEAGAGWNKTLKALVDSVYEEVRGNSAVEDIEHTGAGDDSMMDLDEFMNPADEDDADFVVSDEAELSYEEGAAEKEKKKKKKKKSSKKEKSKKRRRLPDDEVKSHAALLAEKEREDSAEDEDELSVLTRQRPKSEKKKQGVVGDDEKMEEEEAEDTIENDDDAPVVQSKKPVVPLVNRAAIETADLADVPPKKTEFKHESEILEDAEDDSSVMAEEGEEEIDEEKAQRGGEEGGEGDSDTGGEELEEEPAAATDDEDGTESEEEEEEDEEESEKPAKRRRRKDKVETEPRYYAFGETFTYKGQAYEVTYEAEQQTPVTNDGAIDWSKVTHKHLSTCKGPPANKKADTQDYNAFVFSNVSTPVMITIRQARDIDARVLASTKEKAYNREQAFERDNIQRFADGRVKTIMPMNYFHSLAKKRKTASAKQQASTTTSAKRQPLKDITNNNNKPANTAEDRKIALDIIRELGEHKDMFVPLPDAFVRSFVDSISELSASKLQNLFMPYAREFIKCQGKGNQENNNVVDVVKKWSDRFKGSTKIFPSYKESMLLKFFIGHVVFVHPDCKAAFVKRLKELVQ